MNPLAFSQIISSFITMFNFFFCRFSNQLLLIAGDNMHTTKSASSEFNIEWFFIATADCADKIFNTSHNSFI